MAKCELCEGPHGVRLLMVDDLKSHCTLCYSCTGPDAHLRVRARRAQAERPSDTIPAPPIFGIDFGVEPSRTIETTFRKRLDGQLVIEGYTEVLAPPPTAPECRECSRPERPIAATHGELCVYCWHRDGQSKVHGLMMGYVGSVRSLEARARMEAADRKAQPRATAESRMLALPHPWECGGEDEP